jgi:uncharacterized repeat protein (TIGR01451 family)
MILRLFKRAFKFIHKVFLKSRSPKLDSAFQSKKKRLIVDRQKYPTQQLKGEDIIRRGFLQFLVAFYEVAVIGLKPISSNLSGLFGFKKFRAKLFPVSRVALTSFCLAILLTVSQLLFALNPAFALPDICGTPGNDGITPLSGVINAYYPGTASESSGSSSITLGAAKGASTPIQKGDLLLVIQMQDATISSSNDANYGGNNGTGTGYTSLNTAGSYQYVLATNNVPVGGGTVNLAQPLSFNYTNANETGTNGQRRYQVIRVPQYSSATISSTVTSYAWDGSVGGIVAFDVSGSLTFSGAGTINVDGQGFRGGGGSNIAGDGSGNITNTDYVHPAPATDGVNTPTPPQAVNYYDASKGEGIAGTPRYTRDGGFPPVTTVTDNGNVNGDGYPNGSYGRGAPANAGGGGTDPNQSKNSANTGGGGGANAGAGGQGGDSWTDNGATPARQPTGGKGGTAINPSANLIFLGGGGGAGSANDSPNTSSVPSGGGGGGMVIVRTGQLLGNGSITSNGIQGVSPLGTDGGGGGGAGGTILIQSVTASTPSITINANGGNGLDSGYYSHGPGGGGGGGYIAYQGFTPTTNVSAGAAGFDTTLGAPPGYVTNNYGAIAGSPGLIQSIAIPTAQVKPGAVCVSSGTSLNLVKRITAINSININGFISGGAIPPTSNDGDDNWPSPNTQYLRGALTSDYKSNDLIEYTIYFLSNGIVPVKNVQFCDRIPTNTVFEPNGYGTGNGILLGWDSTGSALPDPSNSTVGAGKVALTNAADADTGQFLAANIAAPAFCGNGGANPNGAILVQLGAATNVPNATSSGTPANSYGFVRFKVRVS